MQYLKQLQDVHLENASTLLAQTYLLVYLFINVRNVLRINQSVRRLDLALLVLDDYDSFSVIDQGLYVALQLLISRFYSYYKIVGRLDEFFNNWEGFWAFILRLPRVHEFKSDVWQARLSDLKHKADCPRLVALDSVDGCNCVVQTEMQLF